MGINKFIYLLLICSVVFLLIEKDQLIVQIQDEERPTVSFYDYIMYDITKDKVEQIVQSKEAYIYKKREELVDGVIITRSNNTEQNATNTNLLSGNNIIKMGNNIYIDGNVHLQLSNDINIKTEQLEYNLKTKIAKNNVKFVMSQNNNTFKGKELFLDGTNNHIIAKQTNIKIKVFDE